MTEEKDLTSDSYSCVVCASQDIDIFIEIPDVPVYCNVLYSTRESALNVPTGDMRLGFCNACGHIYNFAFDPDKMDYAQDYENSLHHSPRFQEYASSLATQLIERHNLFNKDIIEIGCGSGDFLKLLCKLGGNRGVGFEPSSAADRFSDTSDNQVSFIKDFYSEGYSNYKADFIFCRHVLEHIQFPLDFLLAIRRAIGKGQRTPVFFEVPNVMFTLKDLSIWDLIYEHPSYFSTSSLAHVFVSSGFKVAQLEEAFVGQFLCIYVSPDGDQTDFRNNHWHESKSIQPLVQTFAYRYDCKLKEWKDDLEMKRREGKKAVVWGAGSKGVTFLNVLKTEDSIEYVVDINPRKRGMRVPGTGQEIKPPEFLKEYQPDSIIIMNAIYIEEVHRIVKQINVLADLVTA